MAFEKLTVRPYTAKINNWSHTFYCHPELIFEPASVEEVQAIVKEAKRRGKKVRPVAEHTSPGQAFCTNDWMVRVHRLNQYQRHADSNTVTLGAGLRLREANKLLYRDGLCFPVVGSIDEVSVAAAFAVATHGSSVNHSTIAETVTACTLVTAEGDIKVLRKDSQDEEERQLFAATGCGAGATGVLVDITVDLEPAFGLAPVYEKMSVREALRKGNGPGGLLDMARKNDYVKIWYFPNTTDKQSAKDDGILYRADKSPPPSIPAEDGPVGLAQKKAIHFLHGLGVFLCTFVFTACMPYFNMLLFYLQSRGTPMQAEASPGYLAQQMDCLYWQLVNEYSVPFSDKEGYGALQALQELIDFLDHDKAVGGGLTAPFEIRFSRVARDFPLSPLNHDGAEYVMYLEPIVYRPLNLPLPSRYHRLFSVFEDIARRNGGKPHLAKTRRAPLHDAELHALYPQINEWRSTVRKADPAGMFWTEFLDMHFGAEAAREKKEKPDELSRINMGKQTSIYSDPL